MTNQTINNDVTLTGGENPLLAGRYQVVRQLGTGGMGSVWLAEDTQLDNKPFAVKMLPSILVSNKRAYRQLKDEALVAMRLVHPNIVQIRAFEENNGNPFLVMDYIEGQTLDDYLAEKGKLSEDETIRLLKPIAAALDYAHGQGVIHRDVKPANVMIRNDGQTFILDFGIAREIQETMTRVTGKLSSGTLLYMSPEQLRGQPPKAAQDVYSFAAMAYECLNGVPPFSRGQIEYQILNEKPTPLPDGVKLSASIIRGLSKEPENRPGTCVASLEMCAEISMRTLSSVQSFDEYTITESGNVKRLTLPGGATMGMIYVSPCSFTMGGGSPERPKHRVTLTKGYWLGQYAVTQEQWQSVMGFNPARLKNPNRPTNPVENISWNDCQRFIKAINIQLGCGARLPTEAEWECACRAGSNGAYGGTGQLDDMGWYCGNSGKNTHPVGQKDPNAWGFYDMHGNVCEHCNDFYADLWKRPQIDPTGPSSGGVHVIRGGFFASDAEHCHSAWRGFLLNSDSCVGWCGFRLCCDFLPNEVGEDT